MVISSQFSINITVKNLKHYIKKGFNCSVGDDIVMSWESVPSYYDIACKCDECQIEYQVKKHVLKIKEAEELTILETTQRFVVGRATISRWIAKESRTVGKLVKGTLS